MIPDPATDGFDTQLSVVHNQTWHGLGQDAHIINTARMVFCFRLSPDGVFSWCHGNNPSRTVHSINTQGTVSSIPILPIQFLGYPAADNYPAEIYEVQAHGRYFTDLELQALCSSLVDKWPAVEPEYPM